MYFEAILFCTIIAIAAVVCVVGILIWQKRKNDKLRENIQSGKFIEANEFLKEWRCQSGRVGYKYNDVSGCYVIQIFNDPPTDEDQKYENVYIGQSVRACERVRNHLTGHGNGDVYADAKYGKYIRIQIVPCKKNMINNLEKDLISAFNATDSYNKTRGGGKRRQ